MTDTEIVQTITKHGLAVRQIPKSVVSIFDIRHYDESKGHKVITLPNGLKRCEETKIPNHAGYWMTQVSHGTSEQMYWIGKPNLAPTLEESIQKYLDAYEGRKISCHY